MSDKVNCIYPPMFRYTWPGRDEAYICMGHALQIKGIANAMGVPLQLIPVEGWQEQSEHECSQMVDEGSQVIE